MLQLQNFFFTINPFHLKIFGALTAFALMKRYFNGPKNNIHRTLNNQIAIITGASAGLGKENARDLLKSGATVIFACRNKEKTLSVIKSITDEKTIGNAHYMNLDLTSFSSVEKVCWLLIPCLGPWPASPSVTKVWSQVVCCHFP